MSEIRNIAIIAHVDHGKTTLTDAIMRQTGAVTDDTSMDSDMLEKERGITIYSKNTSVRWKDTKINIVDTPGHADFGSEVERVLRSIDAVLLIVDAQEGPMPQTRFVLKKSLELGLKPIVVINKIDKPAADPDRVQDEVLELFFDLVAETEGDETQLEFTSLYAIGIEGAAMYETTDDPVDMTPLLDTILKEVPPAAGEDVSTESADLQAQPFNLAYDNFLGRLAIARVYEGSLAAGMKVFVEKPDGSVQPGKISKLFAFEGIQRTEVDEATAGDIVMVAGLEDIYIGDTIAGSEDVEPLPAIHIDEPTIALEFLVNDSPFAGQEGDYVTGRQIRERLEKEIEVNVGLDVDFLEGKMVVRGRGELHIAILLENMRREGYELQISQPQAITKEVDGKKMEPFEEVNVDTPAETQGTVIEKLAARQIIMKDLKQAGERVQMTFEGPTRGLLGYRSQFVVDTKGAGILSSRMIGFKPYAGAVARRAVGSMASMSSGKALAFALNNLQQRGELYISPNTNVYEGMVIGNVAKGDEMAVNPTKGKNLTNMRASGSDENVDLAPPTPVTIERGLEIMSSDEYLEITPKSTRLRKKILDEGRRLKSDK
ncbi:MAG: translational GTPase TypA [Candidatus Paceibacterota bacterium]